MINYTSYVIYRDDESIDVQATKAKFAKELEEFMINRECSLPQIESAVDDVLSKVRSVTMNYLINQVLTSLGCSPDSYARMTRRVNNFMKNNSVGENSKYYVPGRGKHKFNVMLRSNYNNEIAKKAST